ncbi:MAG: M48 family metalloprotease [Pseudomonadota bacterium]
MAGAVTVATFAAPQARAQGLPLIRDTEIENLLRDYSRPIFRAAGLDRQRIRMRIVRADNFNAFVADGRNVFINTGTLVQSNTPNQVIGVIAHETGHIAGSHLANLRQRIARDQTRSLLLRILGIGLMVAGGAAGNEDLGGAGRGVTAGGDALLLRSLLQHRRWQESAADQAALGYLERTGQSGLGMLQTFKRFADQELATLDGRFQDPFMRSHPAPRARIARLTRAVRASRFYKRRDPPQLLLRHNLMRAKIRGYIDPPYATLNLYRGKQTLPARYGRAIAHYFSGNLRRAVQEADKLIAAQPKNPFFHEVKGDFYLRSGQYALAIPSLERAYKLSKRATLIGIKLGKALQASNRGPKATKRAVRLIERAILVDPYPEGFRILATAFYRAGRLPEAFLAQAQAEFRSGNLKGAKRFARRAIVKFRRGSPKWLKADDIIKYRPRG